MAETVHNYARRPHIDAPADRARCPACPSTLGRIVEEAAIHSAVSRLTRDPDPAPTHGYERDPQSGAGNCTCGAAEHHRRHPHPFTAARVDPTVCVCALPSTARCHVEAPRG